MRDILENTKSDKISLKKEIEILNNYLDLERMRCDNSFEYEINIAPEVPVDSVKIPGMFIQPIVENAIVHGVNSLVDRAGHIQIKFSLKSNCVLNCIITDNGIGRKASEELKKNKSKYHQSMGVSISQERIGYYNRTKETETNIEIVDLYDEDGKALGTQVTINLPILK
jgi:LytS/YehU family sensor histidine kinase